MNGNLADGWDWEARIDKALATPADEYWLLARVVEREGLDSLVGFPTADMIADAIRYAVKEALEEKGAR